MLFVAKETNSCKQQQQQRRDGCIEDVGNIQGAVGERYCEEKNTSCDIMVFSFPKHTVLRIKDIFLPDDSGSPIFSLPLLSVVGNTFGIKDGTKETRKQMNRKL